MYVHDRMGAGRRLIHMEQGGVMRKHGCVLAMTKKCKSNDDMPMLMLYLGLNNGLFRSR